MICHFVRHSVSLFLLAYRLYLLGRARTAKAGNTIRIDNNKNKIYILWEKL